MADRPELLTTTIVEPLVSHRTFVIDDVNGNPSIGTTVPSGHIATSGENGIVCLTAGNNFYPTVRIEVWTGEPPHSTETWDTVETVELHSVSGIARVRDLNGTWHGDPIPLGPPITYRLKAHSRGRNEALEARQPFFHGVEEWLLTTWPSPIQTHTKARPRIHVGEPLRSPDGPDSAPRPEPTGRQFLDAQGRSIPRETPDQIRARARLARQMGRRVPRSRPREELLQVDWHDIQAFATAIQEELTPPELDVLIRLLTKPPTS
ncbi:hypothetical protein [Streptomyces sp. B6B3]|uniref:hypothetical protein n=1 Tax=Streptomyces sp. B6B3 TaxID=3153570 RepID=UPI00325C82EC